MTVDGGLTVLRRIVRVGSAGIGKEVSLILSLQALAKPRSLPRKSASMYGISSVNGLGSPNCA